MKTASLKVIRDTIAGYCQDKILRGEAVRILRMAGMKDPAIILDAADANLKLKGALKESAERQK